jgi:parallel beta-helix repeat protein
VGIYLDESPRNSILQNIISNQEFYGIMIRHSNSNTIEYNTAIQNRIGIYINDYIEWLTDFHLTSQRNKIEHNNLYDNSENNAYFENGFFNIWNNNFYHTIRRITIIPGDIYAERGWHFGSPPPISFKCFRLDWHSSLLPFS